MFVRMQYLCQGIQIHTCLVVEALLIANKEVNSNWISRWAVNYQRIESDAMNKRIIRKSASRLVVLKRICLGKMILTKVVGQNATMNVTHVIH